MHDDSIQFHFWPWSTIGCHKETQNILLRSSDVTLPYWGNPLLSVPRDFKITIDNRHEEFLPLGCPYDGGRYQLYRVPHSIAASRRASQNNGNMTIVVSIDGDRSRINLCSDGAVPGSLHDNGNLQQAIQEWMSFFDFCVQRSKFSGKGLSSIPWVEMPACIQEYGENITVQKRSLIVAIAEEMPQLLQDLVLSARRVLVHERDLMSAARAAEMDSGCMQWYFRQPGKSPIQKASANRQRLMSISRHETFNTLENRVLKNFLQKCLRECKQYVRVICSNQINAGYAKIVNRFSCLCSELLRRSVWENVDELESGARPNYVIQSDIRYRKVWELHQKLLRKCDEEAGKCILDGNE